MQAVCKKNGFWISSFFRVPWGRHLRVGRPKTIINDKEGMARIVCTLHVQPVPKRAKMGMDQNLLYMIIPYYTILIPYYTMLIPYHTLFYHLIILFYLCMEGDPYIPAFIKLRVDHDGLPDDPGIGVPPWNGTQTRIRSCTLTSSMSLQEIWSASNLPKQHSSQIKQHHAPIVLSTAVRCTV